jgi:hypothetical protein
MHEGITGELELSGEKRMNEQGTANNKRKEETTEFEERLRLRTRGDVYHKNLFIYDAMLGLGLTQTLFDLDGDRERSDGTLTEYHFGGQLLPTKPYPVSFSLDKSEALTSRRFTSSVVTESEGFSVGMALRDDDWPMRFVYGKNNIEQSENTSQGATLFTMDTERISYGLRHDFSELSNLVFDFDRTDTKQRRADIPLDQKEDKYLLRHTLIFGDNKQNRLDSVFNYFDLSGVTQLEQLRWRENLKLKHSETFETDYIFSYNKSKRPTFENEEAFLQASFTHRLYKSLTTGGSVFISKAKLSDGVESDRIGGKLAFGYRKDNRWGTFFGNYSISLIKLEQTGGSTLVTDDERHFFEVASTSLIRLKRTNIDPSSIVVSATRVDLVPKIYLPGSGNDYLVIQDAGITEIQPLVGGEIVADGDQVLFISYDFFTEPEREEESITTNLSLRQQFSNGLSVYYENLRRDEDITSDDTSIIPNEFEINTFGADYSNKGLRLLAEYTKEDSTRIPSTQKRVQGSYFWPLNQDIDMNVYASNNWIDNTDTNPNEVELFSAGGEMSYRLSDQYTLLNKIDYRAEDDSRQGETEGFQWRTELQYQFRLLSLSVGFELDFLDRFDHETDNKLLYFNLIRSF